MDVVTVAMIGFCAALTASAYMAGRGVKNGIRDLEGQPDQLEASSRQTRQDVAALVWSLGLTNALLAGILGALVAPHL